MVETLKSLSWRHYVIVGVLAFAAYAPTLRVGFLWDDHVIIEHNPWIQAWSWKNLRHDFLSDNTQGRGDDYYRPLQAVSHRIDYSLFGMRPFGFHLTDLLFHVAAGLLLVQLVITLGFTPMTGLLTGCLFVVHPGGIEQFLTASGRTTPLSYAFVLLCLLTFLREESLRGLLAALVCFAAALWTKEIAIITPALVVCVFLYKGVSPRRYLVLGPMAVLAGIYLLMRHHVVRMHGDYSPALIWLFLTHVYPRVLLHYIVLILWPWNLHSHRLIPHLTHAWPLYALGWLGCISAFIWKKNRTGLFCATWLMINLLPTTVAMIHGGFMLDHWSYQANLAVMLPLAILFDHAWKHSGDQRYRVVAMMFFPLIIVWALLVHLNVQLRGTDEKLYRWALHFTTSAPIESNLGIILLQTHRPAEALIYLEPVHDLYPEDINNGKALATAYAMLGQRKRAYALLQDLSRRNPQYICPRPNILGRPGPGHIAEEEYAPSSLPNLDR